MNKAISQKDLKNQRGRKVSQDTFLPVCSAAVDTVLKIAILGLVLLFVLYPMLCILHRSLEGDGGFTLANYIDVWTNYRQNFINSIVVGVSTALSTPNIISMASTSNTIAPATANEEISTLNKESNP